MIVSMQEKATEEQIYAVIEAMEEAGVDVHRTTGATQTILAGVGPTAGLDLGKFEVLPGVLNVHPHQFAIQAGRARISSGRHGGRVCPTESRIGGKQVAVIAGPCAIESREQIFAIAACVKAAGAAFLRGGAFKPRSSPYAFQGHGDSGPGTDARGRPGPRPAHGNRGHGDLAQIEPMLPYADCFQVGARNMQNFNLLRELGQVRKPVLLKRGIAATIEELLLSSEYIISGGNYDVILVRARHSHLRDFYAQHHGHRGHSGGEEALAPAHCGDPSHGTGRRDMVAPMARAAVAAGADGILVEIHPNADKAASDAAQTLYLDQFEKLMGELRVIAAAVGDVELLVAGS
jgi:3-deoxy-7-phosphoheptulonate synthase